MKFENNNTHGKGRPKGSTNKATKQVREFYQNIIEERYEQLNEDLDKLSPKQRWEVILKLSQFVLPKLREVDHKGATAAPEHIRHLMEMNEDTLKKIYGLD